MTENELAKIIVDEAFHVHYQLGPGLLESVYEACLAHRLTQAGLKVEVQKPIPLVYDGIHLKCGFRCDLIVEEKLIIEIKTVDQLTDIHLAQLLTYLKLSNLNLGLLINFNVVRIKNGLRRVVNRL